MGIDNSLEVDEAIAHALLLHLHPHPYVVESNVDVHLAFQNLVPAWEYDGEATTTTWTYYVVIGMEVDDVGTVEEVLPPARLLSLSSQILVET